VAIGKWEVVRRFAGAAYVLYLSRHTTLTVTATSDAEFAVTWVKASKDFAPVLVTPATVAQEIRGGDNATRQINQLMPPGFPCERLVIVEVYTPSGSWSSYPPHKHDVHRTAADGTILEADLEEIYFYKHDKPDGFAFQHVYTDADSPIHQAGSPIDAVVRRPPQSRSTHPRRLSPCHKCTWLHHLLPQCAWPAAHSRWPTSMTPTHLGQKPLSRARPPRPDLSSRTIKNNPVLAVNRHCQHF
jgi:5-deoxy-glucuronate isomerase